MPAQADRVRRAVIRRDRFPRAGGDPLGVVNDRCEQTPACAGEPRCSRPDSRCTQGALCTIDSDHTSAGTSVNRFKVPSERRPWTRNQLLVALGLYLQLPFGRLHQNQPDVIRYAGLIGRTPSALAMKLSNLASLDDSVERAGLRNSSRADRAIWKEMQAHRMRVFDEIAEVTEALTAQDEDRSNESISDVLNRPTGVDTRTEVQARRGQQIFRRAVLSAYGGQCCISGLSVEPLLIASHIVPWAEDPDRRLDPRNGLCLNALHDRAFDAGLIAFDDHLRLLVSSRFGDLSNEYARLSFAELEGHALRAPEKFSPDPSALAYHREHIFVR